MNLQNLHEVLFINWRQKLIAFLLAALIWGYLKEQIDPGTFDQMLNGTPTNTR
jgi:hypothetical protein